MAAPLNILAFDVLLFTWDALLQKMEETGAGSASIMEWMECREDKQKVLRYLIDSVDVYEEKVIEIKWKFRDRLGF